MSIVRFLSMALFSFLMIMTLSGCMRYLTHERSKVLLAGVDIDQTLEVAAYDLKTRRWGSVLTVWAIRDQVFTSRQGKKVSELYFHHIDSLSHSFNRWHLTWAIANIYRQGDDSVRVVLHKAFEDAKTRAAKLGGLADKHVNGSKLFMGDAHSLGRAYAQGHVVVPGNPRYLQSAREYFVKKKVDKDNLAQ